MRALVTGSTGLLGNNLVRTLLDAGHEVWALARSTEKAQRELGDTQVQVVVGDIRNVANFAYDLRGIDVIFHTAAYFREYYNPGDHSNAIELANVRAQWSWPRRLTPWRSKLDSKRRTEELLGEFSREKGFIVASALPSWM